MTDMERAEQGAEIIKGLIDNPPKVFTAKKSVPGPGVEKFVDVCSVNITEPGIYLFIGGVWSGQTDDATVSAEIGMTGGTLIEGMSGRGKAISGGGANTWCICRFAEPGQITVNTYGYVEREWTATGHVAAIRLGGVTD